MSTVTAGTPAGDAYRDLQDQARRSGRPTRELLQLYVLEGFLARLAASPARDSLVLKGGVLLAAFGARRPTADVDLQALRLANDTATVLALVRGILAAEPPGADGIEFAAQTATAEAIREDDAYSGVRVHIGARVGGASLPFHVDVNVGDPIWPAPAAVTVPRLLGGEPIALRGYPVHMVHAEKIVTAVQRGTANTRWRDFGDIWTLSRRHPVRADDLRHAIGEVAAFRGARLAPLAVLLDGFAPLAAGPWAAWRQRSGAGHLPGQFAPVLADVIAFADPVLTGEVPGPAWVPEAGQWR